MIADGVTPYWGSTWLAAQSRGVDAEGFSHDGMKRLRVFYLLQIDSSLVLKTARILSFSLVKRSRLYSKDQVAPFNEAAVVSLPAKTNAAAFLYISSLVVPPFTLL